MSIVKVKLLNSTARLPKRATDGSAGYDLFANIDTELFILANSRVLVPTGVSIELPSNKYVALIYARSGLSIKNGISLSNGVGVIDSDYRGEILISLHNNFSSNYNIKPNERIAQMIITPVEIPDLVIADDLNTTVRETGGFGSTGN